MALFGNDYDREFGNRGGMWGRADRDRMGGPGRGMGRGGQWAAGPRGGQGYDREFRGGGTWGRDRPLRDEGFGRGYSAENRDYAFGGGGYDRGYSASSRYDAEWVGRGAYDREYKSRQQTDTGDPFHDRQSGTPIRMIHGEFERGYDRGYRGSAADYDRGYRESGYRGVDRTRYDRNYTGREPGINNDGYYGGTNRSPRDGGYRNPGQDRDWF
jgi:hypothetical protein